MNRTDLSVYDNSDFQVGRGFFIRTLWYFINAWVFKSYCFPASKIKVILLRLFGATIGKGVVVKPNVNIKYPWKLEIGDYTWVGEEVWIDNLVKVSIGKNCCISQGAFLLCGNHNYKKSTFDLMTGNINLEDGVWIGAKSVVCPGVNAKSHAVLAVQSVATANLESFYIYQGNPAQKIKRREII
jgi:putative colanic acid biosynthesis acetyltransferase WcaF